MGDEPWSYLIGNALAQIIGTRFWLTSGGNILRNAEKWHRELFKPLCCSNLDGYLCSAPYSRSLKPRNLHCNLLFPLWFFRIPFWGFLYIRVPFWGFLQGAPDFLPSRLRDYGLGFMAYGPSWHGLGGSIPGFRVYGTSRPRETFIKKKQSNLFKSGPSQAFWA